MLQVGERGMQKARTDWRRRTKAQETRHESQEGRDDAQERRDDAQEKRNDAQESVLGLFTEE